MSSADLSTPYSVDTWSVPSHSAISELPDVETSLKSSKIMIVDDEPINLKLAHKYLSLDGYTDFITTTDSRSAVARVADERPDVLLLDIMMPHVSGLDILAVLRADKRWLHLPIVILTASTDTETKRRALELGASDFLAKPVDPSELIPRIRNVLTVKKHYDHMQRYSHELEAAVLKRTAELVRSRQEMIYCLARAAEFRDDDTGHHVVRVGRYARLIAAQLAWDGERLNMLEQAAQLHDIGKIGIPDSILLKPGKLSQSEFEIMQKHTSYGRQITQSLPEHEANVLHEHAEIGSRLLEKTESPVLAMAAVVSLSHHERWDSAGYPNGLAGEEIPLEGRIVAVADVFDALSSERPYKRAFSVHECFRILEEGRGHHFDPGVLDAFFAARHEILRTQIEFADRELVAFGVFLAARVRQRAAWNLSNHNPRGQGLDRRQRAVDPIRLLLAGQRLECIGRSVKVGKPRAAACALQPVGQRRELVKVSIGRRHTHRGQLFVEPLTELHHDLAKVRIVRGQFRNQRPIAGGLLCRAR